MNYKLLDKSKNEPVSEEKIITLFGISWERFKAIEKSFEGIFGINLYYLAGVLEIMSPIGQDHEYIKRTLSYLLEVYMTEKGMRFYGTGGYTLEAAGYASGIPDESYSIGSKKNVPDIVIEVIVTSGTLKRREIYKPLLIPEVWFWKSNKITIFRLQEGEYQEVSRSAFFPDLDLDMVVQYLQYADQYDAVQQFKAALRGS